jgi:uracil-DNA glycosylase family 4
MKLTKCEDCPLKEFQGKRVIQVYKGKRRLGKADYKEIPYRGPKKNVSVLGVGESPGGYELMSGKMFTGDSGEVLAAEFQQNGFDPSRMFLANAARCMIMKKEMGQREIKEAMDCCRPALELAIKKLQPKIIITFGGIAMEQVLGKKGITNKRGQFFWSDEFNCWVFPTFHPAFCLRDAKNFAKFKPDIARVVQFIKNGYKIEELGDKNAKYQDVESIRFLLDKKDIIVSIDTETQGKEWTNPNSIVISYSVTDKTGKGYNIWLAHEVDDKKNADFMIKWPRKNGKQIKLVGVPVKKASNFEEKIKELEELLRREDIKKVMANGNYDLHRFEQLGIPREEIKSFTLDVLLAMHALDPDNYKNASLLDVQNALIPEKADHKSQFGAQVNKNDMLSAAKLDPKRHSDYACGDVDTTLGCGLILRNRLAQDRALARYYVHLAHPVETELLYEMQKNGVLFDTKKLPEVKKKIAKYLREKEEAFLELAPKAVLEMATHKDKGYRLTRTDLIRDVFFNKKGFDLDPLEKTKTGAPAVGRKLLKRIRDDLPDNHPAKEAFSVYFDWGPYQKLYSTYLKGFENAVKADGLLHTQISKTFTATQRTGSRDPNLQNIPKREPKIKKIIRALIKAHPGHLFVALDYSQSELRWIAHESGDAVFVMTFRKNGDLHVRTGSMLVRKAGKDPNRLSKEEFKKARQDAKPCNFGFSYGMMPKGFQSYARDDYGVTMSLEEATLFREGFFEEYSGLLPWHARCIEEAKRTGMVRTAFGSIRRLPNIHSEDFVARSEAERMAINTKIQAPSNDMCLFAGLHARREADIDWSRARIVLFIHDELIYEVEEGYVEEFIPKMVEAMQNPPIKKYFGFEMSVPMIAEAQIGPDLANLEDYTL